MIDFFRAANNEIVEGWSLTMGVKTTTSVAIRICDRICEKGPHYANIDFEL